VRVAAAVVAALVLAGCAEPVEQGWAPPAAAHGYAPGAPYAAPAPWVASAGGGWGPLPPAAVAPIDAPAYQRGRASYYSDRLAGRSTAAGERYDPGALTAAHRTLPLGTVVDVARADGRHVTVRINDRGPYGHGRIIDLSRRAAAEIGMLRDGVADVVLRVLWMPRS
jgi:rare lipoprotein A